MKCLDIPVDHRLRKVIRAIPVRLPTNEASDHVEILKRFALQLKYGYDKIANEELNFTLDHAGSATKGGMVVVLHQPHSKQDYTNEYNATISNNATLAAVQELMTVSNNYRPAVYCVLDLLPFIPETVTDNSLRQEAIKAFCQSYNAKQPDVAILCARDDGLWESHSGYMKLKIGQSFADESPSGGTVKVNAFHPSFAVNRQPTQSCLRQLLILEFVKAHAIWSGLPWHEEAWMHKIRQTCRDFAVESARVGDRIKFVTTQEKERILSKRWNTILQSITAAFTDVHHFRRLYFVRQQDRCLMNIKNGLVSAACDAALFLTHVRKRDELVRNVTKTCMDALFDWCATFQKRGVSINLSWRSGLFVHTELLGWKTEFRNQLQQLLQQNFLTLILDSNLCFIPTDPSSKLFQLDVKAQGAAFLRFANGLEDILEIAEHVTEQRESKFLSEQRVEETSLLVSTLTEEVASIKLAP